MVMNLRFIIFKMYELDNILPREISTVYIEQVNFFIWFNSVRTLQ